jgi:hypothetical protein
MDLFFTIDLHGVAGGTLRFHYETGSIIFDFVEHGGATGRGTCSPEELSRMTEILLSYADLDKD